MAEVTVLQVFRSQADAATKIHSNNNNACLCPSMDLIMIKDSYSPKSTAAVKILNTIDRREVATLHLPDPSENASSILCFTWSPNGQSVAVVTSAMEPEEYEDDNDNDDNDDDISIHPKSHVSLFHILAAQAGGEPLEPYHSFTVSGKVESVTWCMVGKDHPYRWKYTMEEEEQEIAWRTQLHYVDQSNKFLPQGGYMNGDGVMDSSVAMDGWDHPFMIPPDENISTLIPKAHNALTALCLNKETGCELYLHGRSRLGTIHSISPSAQLAPFTVSSHDMTYWVSASSLPKLSSSVGHSVSVTHLPWIKDEQSKLKQVSASMASIQQSLAMLDQSVVADDWKTSLKRLDQLLNAMMEELKKYDINVREIKPSKMTYTREPDAMELGEIIRVYISTGASTEGQNFGEFSNISNAMDTFFTKGQMHDRLLERLDESLQTALANVESAVQKFLVRPAQALHVQMGELTRLSLRDTQVVRELHTASGELLSSVTELQKRVVHSRTIIKQFCEWLRSARALVQSKGTTVNPNLKKRRIKPQVLSGVVDALTDRKYSIARPRKKKPAGSLTELVLNLRVTELIKGKKSSSENEDPNDDSYLVSRPVPVQISLEKVKELFQTFVARPFLDVPEEIFPKDEFVTEIIFSAAGNDRIALNTRIGCDMEPHDIMGWTDIDDEMEVSPFSPKVVSWAENVTNRDPICCRQWLIVAKWHDSTIQLYCIPLGKHGSNTECVLVANLELPEEQTILALGFYGRDGKSFLSSGSDGGTGKDGHYDVAFLCQSLESSVPDLMFVPFDGLWWRAVGDCKVQEDFSFKIVPGPIVSNEDDDGQSDKLAPAQIFKLPSSITADEYLLHFSATKRTAMVTSIRSDEGTITHTVLDVAKKDSYYNDDDDEEEEEDEEEDKEN